MEATSSPAGDWLRLNRAWWDDRVPVHAPSGFYDVPGFLAGKDSLRAFEPGEVGDVRGKRLLPLMCHIGLDTLSWARRGAVVTGLDFSRPALDTAVSLAGQAGIGSARFVAAEIGEASRALAGEAFDIVYTDAPWDGLERGEDGLWRAPADQFPIPLMFSLRAAKDWAGNH